MPGYTSPAVIKRLRRHLLRWYQHHQRDLPWRRSHDPYVIWVSEVMLQQTQVNTVVPYYRRFIQRFPSIAHLARAELQTVLKLWEGLGYYARARNMHRAARQIMASGQPQLPASWKALRALPGIGDYIASAVASIAFNQAEPVVDGNVKRVLARLNCFDTPVNDPAAHKVFRTAAAALLDRQHPGIFNQAMMELGALICRPRAPKCGTCPVQPDCQAFAAGQVNAYPKRRKRQPLPQHPMAVGVVFRDAQVLLTRRPLDGLLGGLWEFPTGPIHTEESAAAACRRTLKTAAGLEIKTDFHLTRVRHAYTHFKVTLDVIICRWVCGRTQLNGPIDHRWVPLTQVTQYPLPASNHKFLPILMERCADGCP